MAAIVMKLDHKEIAVKYDVHLCPLDDEIQGGHQVSIEFILENEGTWVIDPCDDNITRPINENTEINAVSMVFDPNGPNSCWLPEARSIINLEPIFQDRILDDLQAYLYGALIDAQGYSHANDNQLYIIEFTVTIKYYHVNRVIDQNIELARKIDKFTTGEVDLDRRPVDDDDWVWVVDRLKDEYDKAAWGTAVEALEKVDYRELDGIECMICIQELCKWESIVKLPSCNHAFHEGCISEWFKTQASCPLCRSVTSELAC